MKTGAVAFMFCLLNAPFVCSGSDAGISYLRDLGPKLNHARSLSVGAKTEFLCPQDLKQFEGISMALVTSALHTPNFERSNEHSYFLTSPVPSGQFGGGFPELTFVTSKTGQVEHVTCYYSK